MPRPLALLPLLLALAACVDIPGAGRGTQGSVVTVDSSGADILAR